MSQNKIAAQTYFTVPKSGLVRLWHWISVVLLVASLTTVIFGSTLFRTGNNINMVQEMVVNKGGTVTPEQARNVAHEYSDKLWMLHKYIGYGLAFMLLCRVVTEVATSKDKKIGTRIRIAMGHRDGFDRNHYLVVQYGYLLFYFMFILMACSGMVLAYEDQKWLDSLHKPAEAVHEFVQWGIYIYLIGHIGGTVVAELTKYPGIVSRMLSGKK